MGAGHALKPVLQNMFLFHFLIFQAHVGKQCSYKIREQEGPDMTGLGGQRKIACPVFEPQIYGNVLLWDYIDRAISSS